MAHVPRLEVDVRFLSDDTMVVFHDSRLEAETTGSGRVEALDAARARDVRLLFDGTTRLCFLHEVVDLLKNGDTMLQVDLKLMRPISEARRRAICEALAPIADRLLVGSQAHWNLRELSRVRLPVALDPTLHMHYNPDRKAEGLLPDRLGIHGLWDDAPIAHLAQASAGDYVAARIEDLVGLLPGAIEWMVDIRTIRHLANLGVALGSELASRGIALAAWTMRDEGLLVSTQLLRELFEIGATTIITDHAETIAGYATGLG